MRGNKFHDAVFGFFQPGAAFANHRLLGLADMIRHLGQLASAAMTFTRQRRQRGFHKQQRAGNIHQVFARRRALPGHHRIQHRKLLFHQFAWLAETEHGNGVCHLLECLTLGLEH